MERTSGDTCSDMLLDAGPEILGYLRFLGYLRQVILGSLKLILEYF